MFKSGNVLSSDGRGIVREVRVAVFAVISRHIRKRFSFVLSLSLVLLLLLLRATLLLILMYGLCLDVILFVVKIKRLLGSFFHGLISLLQKREEAKFHIYTPQHARIIFAVGWTRERREDFGEQTREKKKRGFVCPPLCVRERERDTVLPHTIEEKWEKAWNLACGST